MTVKAGRDAFNLNGIPGTIEDAEIMQPPKTGVAGVEGPAPFTSPNRDIRVPTNLPTPSWAWTNTAVRCAFTN